jgi:hypothetical protein
MLGLALLVALSVAFVGSLLDAARNPQRWARLYASEARWREALAWTWAITLAAIAGAALAGASGDTLGMIAVAGFAVSYVVIRFIANAALNERMRDLFT